MKEWQKGIPLEQLVSLEDYYKPYNQYSCSQFSEVKKNNIAEWLDSKQLNLLTDEIGTVMGAYRKVVSKVKSEITMHGKTVIGIKEPGDITLTCVQASSDTYLTAIFDNMEDENVWFYVWRDDQNTIEVAKKSGFKNVGHKITTHGEIIAIMFKDNPNSFAERTHPVIPLEELVNIKKITKVPVAVIEGIRKKLEEVAPDFQNHYSNYNKSKSWSAISLRGYSSDPLFIEKPEEMNKAWHEKHANETFTLQDTKYRKLFPVIDDILKVLDVKEVHRIRFMKLKPGGGELSRHTDQVDPDARNTIGGLVRLHYPIITNANVTFSSWTPDGEEIRVNMKVGECWMLDTRKPHMVVNNGTSERIHLVIDVVQNDTIRKLLLGGNDTIEQIFMGMQIMEENKELFKALAKSERCNCDASCGENRYHDKGTVGCIYERKLNGK